MSENIIDTMASDLGLSCFQNESLESFRCRVIYSAMASWIKAIAMDQPVYSNNIGVSRRYIYDRSKVIFDTMSKMYPESRNWFIFQEEKEHPVILIRTRLLKHGDLLNKGFNTSIVLSHHYSKQMTSEFETVYGKILSNDIEYSGIATIRKNNNDFTSEVMIDPLTWLDDYLRSASWSLGANSFKNKEYFDPYAKQKNNYYAWSFSPSRLANNVYLIRVPVNNSYEYYLLKPKENLIHTIDPFFKKQGHHIRIMNALRVDANNMTEAKVSGDHSQVKLQLNTSLPEDINVLLESYAWPYSNIKDRYCWIMTPFVWRFITPYIISAGIKVTENSYG